MFQFYFRVRHHDGWMDRERERDQCESRHASIIVIILMEYLVDFNHQTTTE